MKLTFLGTGTSTGVPEVLCTCAVCSSSDPRDQRLRCSSLLEADGVNILFDCSPDFRYQALRSGVKQIDAVLITHEHYDHTGGLDDLRPFTAHREIPIYAEEKVESVLRTRMPYCFNERPIRGVPLIYLQRIEPDVTFQVAHLTIEPIRVLHGRLPIVGYKIGRMAYLTDVSSLPAEEWDKLKGLDTLIVNALRPEPHVTHQSFGEALEMVERLQPAHAYFIHMSHHAGLHDRICRNLPKNVTFAYDGLTIDIE